MHTPDPAVVKLTAELDELNKQWRELRKKAQAKKKELNAAVVGEQLDHWGLNEKQYAEAKAAAKEHKIPTHVALNVARQAANKARREAQTATATPANAGVAAAKV